MAPEIVHQVLATPGTALDARARRTFEDVLRTDFSRVRVHTGTAADTAAQSVNARAFTVGNHLVFGASQYAPGTRAGDSLLAHELTHVVQQRAASHTASADLRIEPTNQPAEREAATAGTYLLAEQPTHVVQPTDTRAQTRQVVVTSHPLQIARFAETEEDIELEEPELEVENYERYGIPPRTFRGLMEVLAEEAERRQTISHYERPVATLDPGGKPPDFITIEGEGQVLTKTGTLTYRRRSFHVLEAIRYGVGRAATEKDLEAVATTFLGYTGPPGARPDFYWLPMVYTDIPLYPHGFDPGGELRLDTYQTVLAERIKAVPALSKSRLAVLGKKRKTGKGCTERAVSPGGENLNPMANLFAAAACRLKAYADFEWRVTTPTGGAITYDGKIGNTVYECKCGYDGLIADLKSSESWRVARAERRLADEFDEQMRRQQLIATECGFGYRYMVSSAQLAALLRHRWPDVFVDEYPWYDTCG